MKTIKIFPICQIDASDWGTPVKDQALLDCLIKATPQQIISVDHVRKRLNSKDDFGFEFTALETRSHIVLQYSNISVRQ